MGNNCVAYKTDVKCRQDVRIINYELGGSDWYWSNLVSCLGMGLERLAKIQDTTELSAARPRQQLLHSQWSVECHTVELAARWDAHTRGETLGTSVMSEFLK